MPVRAFPLAIPVADETGARIAAHAIGRVGVRFSLHGRTAQSGLDCVGLLADALRSVGFDLPVPTGYGLRGNFDRQALRFFDAACFHPLGRDDADCAGDFCLARIVPRQLHFVIFVGDGFVHAHAGLRRVVLTPNPLPWPVIGRWRYTGD